MRGKKFTKIYKKTEKILKTYLQIKRFCIQYMKRDLELKKMEHKKGVYQ